MITIRPTKVVCPATFKPITVFITKDFGPALRVSAATVGKANFDLEQVNAVRSYYPKFNH